MDEANNPFAIKDLVMSLEPGDEILFSTVGNDKRKQPLEVVDRGGSRRTNWISVEGPRGGEYDIAWSENSRPFIPDKGDIDWLKVVSWNPNP